MPKDLLVTWSFSTEVLAFKFLPVRTHTKYIYMCVCVCVYVCIYKTRKKTCNFYFLLHCV